MHAIWATFGPAISFTSVSADQQTGISTHVKRSLLGYIAPREDTHPHHGK